jgi:hypothetical protein
VWQSSGKLVWMILDVNEILRDLIQVDSLVDRRGSNHVLDADYRFGLRQDGLPNCAYYLSGI